MSEKIKMRYGKLPGSEKQRNRARHVLKLETIAGGWKVTGGASPHIVMQIGTELTCDCGLFQDGRLCSHIIKVQMGLGIFPEFPVYVPVAAK